MKKIIETKVNEGTMKLSPEEFENKKTKMIDLIEFCEKKLMGFDIQNRGFEGSAKDMDGDEILPNLEFQITVSGIFFKLESRYNLFDPKRSWEEIKFSGGGSTSRRYEWTMESANEILKLTKAVEECKRYAKTLKII